MSQPGGGPPPGAMAPGPPRPSLAPGPPLSMQPGMLAPSMQPGPPQLMAPGQPLAMSMAPGAMHPGPVAGSALPQPLNMDPGMAPPPGASNGAPRPLAPVPVPTGPMASSLAISPLNMNPSAQGPPAHMGVSAAQVLNLNLQPNQVFAQTLAQQLSVAQQQAGLKRPADPPAPGDGNPAAKRMRSGEVDTDAAAAGIVRPPSANPALHLGGQPQSQPQQQQPQQQQQGQAAPPDLSAALMPMAAAVAAAAGRPNPLAAAVALQQAAAAQAAATAQAAALAQAAARRRAAAAAAVDVDDERKLLPRRGIRMALRAEGMDRDYVMDPATEAALLEFYSEWIGNAVSLGCDVAKRRKSNVVKARDIALHLERSWHLHIPGFSGELMRPYRRPHVSELHRQRQLAVRRTAAELDHQQQHTVGLGGQLQVQQQGLVQGAGAAGALGAGGPGGSGGGTGGV